MSSDATAALPMWGGPWTGPDGSVHINNASEGRTYCGLDISRAEARPIRACDGCIGVSLARYVATHTGIRGLMKRLDLVYGALDFVIGPDEEWAFMEINPAGQYGWLQHHTGVDITAQLADLLMTGEKP